MVNIHAYQYLLNLVYRKMLSGQIVESGFFVFYLVGNGGDKMNKITSGLLGVAVVTLLVAGAAFAQLTDSASLTNIALSTGTADLLIKLTADPSFDQNRNVSGTLFDEQLIPGEFDEIPFDLKNDTTSDTPLILTGLIPADPTGNWNELKAVISCVVYIPLENPDGSSDVSSGWFTLEQWRSTARDLPGDPLDPDEEVSLILRCLLPGSSGNEVANMSLTGMEFEVTGTQAL